MTAEVGKKCIAVPSRSGGYSYADGHVPEVGERVMAYPLADGSYFVMPVSSVQVGDRIAISPDLVPIGDSASGWSWYGWGYIYTGTGGYSSILETSGNIGTFGVYMDYDGIGGGCWSSVTRSIPGYTFTNFSIDINVGCTDAPTGKFTKISINGTEIYNKSAAATGMEQWVHVNIPCSVTDPTIKIECDCPVASQGVFALSVKNLLFS